MQLNYQKNKVMKKTIMTAIIIFSLFSCNSKTPEQRAQEAMDRYNTEQLKKEVYRDSLVSVACGIGENKYRKQNRLNAIDLLEKDYPDLKPKLDSLRNAIYQGNY